MNNADYLKQKKISAGTTTHSELLTILDGYGDNSWWLSENPRTRAYYQTMDENSPFIIPYQQYIHDLGILLGREVQLYEIRMSNKAELKREVAQAWGSGVFDQKTTYSS